MTPRHLIAASALCAGLLALTTPARAAAPIAPVPTLFGPAPEVYVSPTVGGQGTTVRVVGLGLRPGLAVSVSALDFTAGCSHVCPAVARAVVGPHGLVRLSFVARYPTGLSLTPLLVMVQDRAGHVLARTTFLLEGVSS